MDLTGQQIRELVGACKSNSPPRNFVQTISLKILLTKPLKEPMKLEVSAVRRNMKYLLIDYAKNSEIDFPQVAIDLRNQIIQNTLGIRKAMKRARILFVERSFAKAFNQQLGKYLKRKKLVVYGSESGLPRVVADNTRSIEVTIPKGGRVLQVPLNLESTDVSFFVDSIQDLLETLRESLPKGVAIQSIGLKTCMSSYVYHG